MKKLIYILCLLTCITSCIDNIIPQEEIAGGMDVGEQVSFTTSVPKLANATRALNTELLSGYQTIAKDYELTIKMLKNDSSPLVGSCTYIPVKTSAAGASPVYDIEGTLEVKNGETPLLWESSALKYAFEATAGSDVLATDQSTPEKLLGQDRLHGYAFSPFEPENGDAPDRVDRPNYHTSKEWYQLNKSWHEAAGEMKSSEDFKKIPLFMQHERAWVTIILKAGKGVKREAVEALYDEQKNTYNPNVHASIISYKDSDSPVKVTQPLVGQTAVEYTVEDVNGGVETRQNLKFDAIVEPHDYFEKAGDDKIAEISLAGLNFSFFASNDSRFQNPTVENKAALESAYNLEAGKHLTIEATLETSRIVFITAWIEEWTEVVTSTICDDYGRNGDPTVIKSRADLIAFLNNSDLNSSGNMAIIGATELNLDEDGDPWTNYNNLELKATLNLASATLKSSGRLFSTISSTGNLMQGTIVMNNATAIPSAIAETNDGTIDNISLVAGTSASTVTRAGFVVTNHGYITKSSSSIPVIAGDETSETFVGGIAAESLPPQDNSTIPTIDKCIMYAFVNGGDNVKGGGIVGKAQGRLTNNTYGYGVTLLQDVERFKNIIHTAIANNMTVSGNSWPTLADNTGAGTNVSDAKYHGVLSSQEELVALLSPEHNQIDRRYRVSDSFAVMAESWNYGVVSEDISTQTGDCGGNIYCELDGDGNTITLDATGTSAHMLFSNITGYVHDLTIELAKPLIAEPGKNDQGDYDATDAIAPLAYSVRKPQTIGNQGVNGNYGVIRNVKVKMREDAYVQGATASGLVCWAHRGGVVDNCQVRGSIKSWTPKQSGMEDGKRYIGGVVACASVATITNCTYYQYANKKTFCIANDDSGKMNTFYGGVLGGTSDNVINGDHDYPAVSIIDCASWYQATFPNNDEGNKDKLHHGAILGYSYYDKDNVSTIGTKVEGEDACQGNWWQADMDGVARGGVMNGLTIETTIGRRNAVTPDVENF